MSRRRKFKIEMTGEQFVALCSETGIVLKGHRRHWSKATHFSWEQILDAAKGQLFLHTIKPTARHARKEDGLSPQLAGGMEANGSGQDQAEQVQNLQRELWEQAPPDGVNGVHVAQ